MIRIVGIQRHQNPAKEFVLLQNQGSMRLALRGHLLLTEDCLQSGRVDICSHVFSEDTLIPPGMFVLLVSGHGINRWTKAKDGGLIYYCFMNRDWPVWDGSDSPLHLLSTQHSFTERREAMLLLK